MGYLEGLRVRSSGVGDLPGVSEPHLAVEIDSSAAFEASGATGEYSFEVVGASEASEASEASVLDAGSH